MFTTQFYQELVRTHRYAEIGAECIDYALPNISRAELARRWLCHDGGQRFAEVAMHAPELCAITTGIGLSGPPHAGTVSQIMRALFLQRAGCYVQFVLGDLDAYNGKKRRLGEVRLLARKYSRFLAALGFDDRRGRLRDQFDALDVLRTMCLAAQHITDEMCEGAEEDLHAVYVACEKVDATMTFRRKVSLALMTADFIDLAREGYRQVLVTLGVDEHRYVRFAQRVSHALGRELPAYQVEIAAMYSPMIVGFNGHPKMSKSFPGSGIDLEMEADEIRERIVESPDTATGPLDCPVVQMLLALSSIDDKQLATAIAARSYDASQWRLWKLQLADEVIEMGRIWKECSDV